jgi:hypothetical protein
MLDGRLHVQFVNRPDPMGITEVNYPYDIEVPTGCNGEPDGAPTWSISADCSTTLSNGYNDPNSRARITITYPDGLGIYPAVDNRLPGWACTLGSAHNTIECLIQSATWSWLPNPLVWNFPTPSGTISHTFSEFPGILPTCEGGTTQPFAPDMGVTATCIRPGQYRVAIDTNFDIDRLTYWGGAPIPPGSCTGLGTHNAVCMVDRLESDGRVWVSAIYNLCSDGTCTPRGVTLGATPSTCPAGSTPTREWGATISCNDPNFAGENIIFINYPAEYAYHIRTITTPGAAPACNLWFNGDLGHLFYVICYRAYTATPFTINLTLDDGTYISQPFDPTTYIASCGAPTTGGGQPGGTTPGGGTQPGGGTTPPLTCADGYDKASCSAISGCIWWSRQGQCQNYPEPDCTTYEKESSCTAGACYWWGSACHAYAFDCYATYGTDKDNCLLDPLCDWEGSYCFNR